MYKYWYGKKSHVEDFCETGRLRFSDIRIMAMLDKQAIRDDETTRGGTFSSNELKSITLDGRTFPVVRNTEFKLSRRDTEICYVRCLSNKKNCSELFKLFQADICIAIDVDVMCESIMKANTQLGIEIEVEAKKVQYVKSSEQLLGASARELVFQKHIDYESEDEFRVALFFPKGQNIPGHDQPVFSDEAHKDNHLIIKLNKEVIGPYFSARG